MALARAAFPLCLHHHRQQLLQEEQVRVAQLPSGNGWRQKLRLPVEAAALLASGLHYPELVLVLQAARLV